MGVPVLFLRAPFHQPELRASDNSRFGTLTLVGQFHRCRLCSPSIYVQQRSLPGGDVPILGIARNAFIDRAGRVSEAGELAMVDHYLLVVGYEDDHFVVVELVIGYRTVSAQRLARYRRSFDNASIVFSAPEAASAPVA